MVCNGNKPRNTDRHRSPQQDTGGPYKLWLVQINKAGRVLINCAMATQLILTVDVLTGNVHVFQAVLPGDKLVLRKVNAKYL